MNLTTQYQRHILRFNFEAGTSRGALTEKPTWFVSLRSGDGTLGIGECSPLPGLSKEYDSLEQYERRLSHYCKLLETIEAFDEVYSFDDIHDYPSILMGLETALQDLQNGGRRLIFDNEFYRGQRIPINGLVWMGSAESSRAQIDRLMAEDYGCIKMKVGAIDFDAEIELIKYCREVAVKARKTDIVIRVDANGAFHPKKALDNLLKLKPHALHSIEQPIAAGQRTLMRELCDVAPVPVALDEELIGLVGEEQKGQLLDEVKPQHIVLKPSLIGGFRSAKEWIRLAEARNIGWWITSALESNVGLNAICQFTQKYKPESYQGLGTGQLYENNVPSPLTVEGGSIRYDVEKAWDLSVLQTIA